MSHSQSAAKGSSHSVQPQSGGFAARWSFSVDDLLDNEGQALEIDSPDIYLTFQLADKPQIQKALTLLESGRADGDNAAACEAWKQRGKFKTSTDELVLGHFGHANVFLIRDDEECPRFYIVVGGKSKFKARVSLEGDRIRSLARALKSVVDDE